MKILVLGYVEEQWPAVPQLCETAAERPGGNIGGLGEETEELPVL